MPKTDLFNFFNIKNRTWRIDSTCLIFIPKAPLVRFFFSVPFAVQELCGNYPTLPPLKIIMVRSLNVSERVAWFFKSFVVIWEQYLGNIEFCLHYTTEHTQKLRHERVGQPDPRDVFFTTISLQQSG